MANPTLLAKLGYLTLATADTYLATRSSTAARRARFVTKPLLMPALAAATHLRTQTSAAGRRHGAAGLTTGTQVAQAFSWGGDVALLGKSQPAFLGGVASFFAAHLAYIAAFATAKDPGAALSGPGPKAAAAAWVTTAPVMAIAAGRKDASLRAPVAAYASVLSTMFATSTTLRRTMPTAARRKILLGTSLFLVSDSLLGVQEFLREERSPMLEGAVMATYTAGQWFIADGVTSAD